MTNLKYILPLLLGLVFTANGQSNEAENSSAIIGTWMDVRGEMVLTFHPCGDEFCARIVDLPKRDDSAVDEKNPDRALRSRPLIGLQVVDGLRFEAPNQWTGGTMYAPRRGVSVGIRFELVAPDRLQATASKLLIKRRIEWRRVK